MVNYLLPAPIIAWASTILLATTPLPKSVVFRVCQSPGCRDDGAIAALDKLTALAPPGVEVVKGGCVSLCGSGPVVELCDDGNGDDLTISSSIKKKRVKDEALVSLLDDYMEAADPPGDGKQQQTPVFTTYMRNRLLEGYEFSVAALDAYNAKKYELAVELYEEAIQNGRKPALLLQEARESYYGDTTGDESESESQYGYPAGLRWLVESFRNSCRSRLALGDTNGARRDAFAATVFSKNTDAESHECLADVCQASGDVLGEWQAVKAAINQLELVEEEYSKPLPGKDAVARAAAAKIRSDAAARKRELGFRVVKLEKALRAS